MVFKLLFIYLLLFCSLCFAEQQVTGFEDKDLPVLNDKFSDIKADVNANLNKINKVKLSGFTIILSGDLEVANDVIPSRVYLPFAGTFSKIIAYAKTAPTGADVIIDVNKNGNTILDASKVTISATTNSVTVTSFADTTFSAEDYVTIDVDQIGSTIAGADIAITFFITKATL